MNTEKRNTRKYHESQPAAGTTLFCFFSLPQNTTAPRGTCLRHTHLATAIPFAALPREKRQHRGCDVRPKCAPRMRGRSVVVKYVLHAGHVLRRRTDERKNNLPSTFLGIFVCRVAYFNIHLLTLFRTAVPFWGQNSQNLTGSSLKRDYYRTRRVDHMFFVTCSRVGQEREGRGATTFTHDRGKKDKTKNRPEKRQIALPART